MHKTLILTLCGLTIAGCDQLGIESPAQLAAAKDAEGRAIGGACRHSGRALEDCYTLNKKASKAAIFTGWRDMDAYMRENSIEVVPPTLPPPDAKKKSAGEEHPPEGGDKPAKKDGAGHASAELPIATPVGGGKMI